MTERGPCHWVAPDLCSSCACEHFETAHGPQPVIDLGDGFISDPEIFGDD
jgi:hypothetical protein